ncbi:carboxypeptidase-like regulatory domain-containing protein [Halomarina oriensis]|uniref:PGF-CTERM sorting domain-containing protein n=1 Tax=Halomarina oriensis TaxID=671145 RepID=A0A6B0GHL8_9EURY|nr:carboxypeptidase-like regulatory domain-containing protein [Halomarina oriensis]MWG32909.1 PGF-CTERM sorting domain-containing protein [Halomarina oriensis]
MRTKYVLLVALLLLVSVVTPAAATAPQEQVTLTVSVVDQHGTGVGGATLTASWDGGDATETTRSNGQALIDVPRGASVALTIEDDDYVRNLPKMVPSAEGGDVTVDVAKKGSATVRVESAGGEALSDARVIVSQNGTTITHGETNENGGFNAASLEQGGYDLRVVKPGYYATEQSLTVRSSFSLQPVTIEQGEVTARFGVVDDHFEEPRALEAATVKVGSLGQFNTSDDGTRAVSVPVNTEFEVRVSKPGYETATRTVSIGEEDETTTLAIQRTPALSVVPANTQVVVDQTVEVQVTDEYGDAVADATLRVDGEAVGTTDSQGTARLPIDSAGDHDVTAVKGEVTADAIVVEGVSGAQQAQDPATATATAEPTGIDDPTTTTESSGTGPGFGVVLALLALLGTVGLLTRRR